MTKHSLIVGVCMGKCLRENHRGPYMTTDEIAVGLSVFFSANSIVGGGKNMPASLTNL